MTEILIYALLTSIGILSIYWFLALIKIGLYKKKEASSNIEGVSVIVCAHNELDNLKELLPELESQQHPNFEIIIVDDRSDDGTYDYMLDIKSEKIKHVRVDQVHDHINAKKYAITLGVKAAKNNLLLFTDADCRPQSDQWISSMATGLSSSTQFVLGASQYFQGKGLLNALIRYETLMTACNYLSFALAGNPYMGVGRNLAYKKDLFLSNKGFNKYQHVTGGDDDLFVNQFANSKNTSVAIGEESLTHSVPKNKWGHYFSQKLRHLSVSKYYSFKDKFLLGLQSLANLVFWPSLIILALETELYPITAGVLLFRWLVLSNLNYFTSKKIGDRMNSWLVPILDLLYVLLVTVIGGIAIFTKKVKWKK